jgi:tripartite-type tricarboxylate transporter receptor subunit TctC
MTTSRLLRILVVSVFLLTLGISVPVLAEYPDKPVQLMIPYGGGGSTDVTARMLANLAQKDFPKSIVVVNKPGGGGVLMHELLAQAKPDGYTLGVVSTGVMTRTPFLRKVATIQRKDFTYIMLSPCGSTAWWLRPTAPGRRWPSSWTTPRRIPARLLFHRRNRIGPVPGHGIPGPERGHQVDPHPF